MALQSGGANPMASSLVQRNPYQTPAPRRPLLPAITDAPAEEPAHDDLWQRIRSNLSWQEPDNKRVEKAVDDYLDQPGYLPTVSERGSLYLYYIVEEVEKRGMPMEIALVPLVESTLDPFAYSPGHAAGLWQIMPATGEHLGLQQDDWFDGRRAVRDSTQVALDYLEQLHEEFDNDWLLALAAYNAGEGRVARAMQENLRQGLPTDYWSLELPRETRKYIPKVLALSQILAEPEAHAVELPPVANAPAFEVVDTGGPIELARAAELADISLETLREFNPGQLGWTTAPTGPQQLLLPVGTSDRFEQEIAELTPAERVRWRHYVIRPGDNLIGIARKFHTEVGLLRKANGISGNTIRAGNTLLIPGSDSGLGVALGDLKPAAIEHKVQPGDSLWRIAGKYNVSVSDIVAWNSLDPGKHLRLGQQLKLHVKGS